MTTRTLEETVTSTKLETSSVVVPVTTTRTAIDSSVRIQTLEETQTSTDVVLSTNVVSTRVTQTETVIEPLTSLDVETSLTIVPTISNSIETSILTLVRSGTTFTAESIQTSYVTISLTNTPTPAIPSNLPTQSVSVPASAAPSESSSTSFISEGSGCSSYGPSTTPDASVCGEEECRVGYELVSFITWEQFPEKPPVVTEIVFVSAN